MLKGGASALPLLDASPRPLPAGLKQKPENGKQKGHEYDEQKEFVHTLTS